MSVNTSTGCDGGSTSELGRSCASLILAGAAQSDSSLETIDAVPAKELNKLSLLSKAYLPLSMDACSSNSTYVHRTDQCGSRTHFAHAKY